MCPQRHDIDGGEGSGVENEIEFMGLCPALVKADEYLLGPSGPLPVIAHPTGLIGGNCGVSLVRAC